MSERVEIGRVCEKSGGHSYFIGDSDYGVCGSHEFATIYVTVEIDRTNSRGSTYTAEDAAEEIRHMVKEYERLSSKEAWDQDE